MRLALRRPLTELLKILPLSSPLIQPRFGKDEGKLHLSINPVEASKVFIIQGSEGSPPVGVKAHPNQIELLLNNGSPTEVRLRIF